MSSDVEDLVTGGEVAIRPWTADDDYAFVRDAWARSLHAREQYVAVDQATWLAFAYPAIGSLLKRREQETSVLIACDPTATDVIYGFLVVGNRRADDGIWQASVAHYVYVKAPFRGFGIATRLLREVWPLLGEHPVYVSTMPPLPWLQRYRMRYNPFLGLTTTNGLPATKEPT